MLVIKRTSPITTDLFCCIDSSSTFTPTPSSQQSTSSAISACLDRSKQHSLHLYVSFQGKRIELNGLIVFELQLLLLHQLIFHIHTHTFHSSEHIFSNIHPLGPIKAVLFVFTSAFREKRIKVHSLIVFELRLVLLHQLIFYIHTHTFHSTEHIFGNICTFGPIKTAFSLSSRQLSGK